MRTTRRCDHCGKPMAHASPGNPPSAALYCSSSCFEAWLDSNPEEAKHWRRVADLTPLQLAGLEAELGLGSKC